MAQKIASIIATLVGMINHLDTWTLSSKTLREARPEYYVGLDIEGE